MNNDELLRAIGELIKAETKSLKEGQEQIRKDMVTKNDLAVNNKVIGTIVQLEIATLKQELVKLGKNIVKRLNDQDDRIEEIKTASHPANN